MSENKPSVPPVAETYPTPTSTPGPGPVPAPTQASSATEVVAAAPTLDRETQALAIVKTHVPWAIGGGVLPIPGVDLAAVVAVQLRMLSKLANHYGVPFKRDAAKSVVVSLLGDVLGVTLAGGLASLVKFVPVLGTAVGIAAMPALAGAVTYAIGKVFVAHFETGGTFLDLDPKKVKGYFLEEFEKAKQQAAK